MRAASNGLHRSAPTRCSTAAGRGVSFSPQFNCFCKSIQDLLGRVLITGQIAAGLRALRLRHLWYWYFCLRLSKKLHPLLSSNQAYNG
jgi:hypothetical protein